MDVADGKAIEVVRKVKVGEGEWKSDDFRRKVLFAEAILRDADFLFVMVLSDDEPRCAVCYECYNAQSLREGDDEPLYVGDCYEEAVVEVL